LRKENLPQTASGGQQSNTIFPPDEQAAFKFLDFLFKDLRGGYIEFRYFSAGPKPRVVDESTYLPLPYERDRVLKEVLSRNGYQMITVGPAPRFELPERGKAGKDRDVICTPCVWADLDFKQSEGGAAEVIRRIRHFPLRPTVVINTGYGRHIYFVFHQPLRANDLPDWEIIVRGLRDALHGDAVINISRVMRLPGTFNIKQPTPAACEILEEDSSWTRYSMAEVKRAVEEALSREHEKAQERGGEQTGMRTDWPFLELEMRRRGVPWEMLRSIQTGEWTIRTGTNAGRSDDESGRDFWIATSLFERGFKENEIKAIFTANPEGCGSKAAQPRHGEKYLELTITKARARYQEKKARGDLSTNGDCYVQAGEVTINFETAMNYGVLPPCYSLRSDDSLWFTPPASEEDQKPPKPTKVCDAFISIDEIQENIDTGQITVVIRYEYLGRERFTTISRSQMNDSRQLVAALAGEGAPVNSNNARLVLNYLAAYERAFRDIIRRKKVTSRFGRGRSNDSFFLPGLSEDIQFAPSGSGDASLFMAFKSRRGALNGWLEAMRALDSASLMIPQVVVLTTFVPPLQAKLQIPNFILDLNGNTTTGKSTSLKLGASVFGNPDDKSPDSLILQWTNTKVAIEQIASMCCDLPVFLDDAQHTPDDLKRTVIYMIANGRGKGRGARGGGIRETPTWRTVALSTSEEPLHESSPHEGARGRLLPIGGFTPPFPPNSGNYVQQLESYVIANHGHAGELYIRHLNGLTSHDWSELQRRYAIIRSHLIKCSSSDLVGRVSSYIAAIQVAAEIACPLIGLPFKPDVVAAWLILHLDEQQKDQNMVLHALRVLADHYVSNTSLFAPVSKSGESEPHYMEPNGSQRKDLQGAVKRKEYVAFTRSVVEAVFQKRKWNATALLNKLVDAGALLTTEKDRHTKRVSVDGVQHRMVCIKWVGLFPNDDDEQD
jgi:hypothetical protein